MRFEMVQTAPGITRSVPYLECWHCSGDVLETQLSAHGLCLACQTLADDGFIPLSRNEDEEGYY